VAESSFLGSKAWANQVLKIAIHEVYNVGRDIEARRVEVHYWLFTLHDSGFKWQEDRLRNHINRAIKKGVFSFTASLEADSNQQIGGIPC
jgi:hypothetical protein